MTSIWKHIFVGILTLVITSVLTCVWSLEAKADLGDQVVNVATVSQSTPTGRLEIDTNPAAFTIEARETPSDIEFFRIAVGAPDAVPTMLNGSDFSPSGALSGPFVPIVNVPIFGGAIFFVAVSGRSC